MKYFEVNFDGLVGPSHNYAGLAEGNLASAQNSQTTSYPASAALQGLEKMKLLMDLGLKQAVLPPQLRPDTKALSRLGFNGSKATVINKVSKTAPHLLASIYSASNMWTANCATVSPSNDTRDGKLHLTPANLISHFHRSIEADPSEIILRRIFHDKKYFSVHQALPSSEGYADEGAANHLRFSDANHKNGLELFIYGKGKGLTLSKSFTARQSLAASKAIIDNHGLSPASTILARQSRHAIDQGIFHNDVISTANQNLFLLHEHTFENQTKVLKNIQSSYQSLTQQTLYIHEVSEKQLPIEQAVKSYLFNTQIVTLKNNSMLIIAPIECQENPHAKTVIDEIIASDSHLNQVKYVDLRQSMSNGGGPACLRLRVLMNEEELKAMHQGVLLTDSLYLDLKRWITKHYREEIKPKDLADPQLLSEIEVALTELTEILQFDKI